MTSEIDDRTWISAGMHGVLSAKYFDNVDGVALSTEDGSWRVYLAPERAANLALSLLRAAAAGGFDVVDHLESAALDYEDTDYLVDRIRSEAIDRDDAEAAA